MARQRKQATNSVPILQMMRRLGQVYGGQNLPERWPAGSAARRCPFERWELKLALVVKDERGSSMTPSDAGSNSLNVLVTGGVTKPRISTCPALPKEPQSRWSEPERLSALLLAKALWKRSKSNSCQPYSGFS
jgi:hypothetical protein